jgi:hypothetical protein
MSRLANLQTQEKKSIPMGDSNPLRFISLTSLSPKNIRYKGPAKKTNSLFLSIKETDEL